MMALVVRMIMFVTLFALALVSTDAGAQGSGVTIEQQVTVLNSIETAQDGFAEAMARAGLGWDNRDSERKVHSRVVVAFTDYLMRTALTASPGSGNEGLRELGYDDTQAMEKSILRMEEGPARDRAVIVMWNFHAAASVNFTGNRNDFHPLHQESIAAMGREGVLLNLRAATLAAWVYREFGHVSTGPDIILNAIERVYRAGLERDVEVRSILKAYIEKTFAFVSNLDDSRDGREQRAAIWNRDQNPKSLPSAFINQLTAVLGVGVTFDAPTTASLKEGLRHSVLVPGKSVDEYHRSKISGSEATRVFAEAYLRLLDTPRDLTAIKEMLRANEFMFRIDDVGNTAGRYLFKLEMESAGWLAKLVRNASADELRFFEHARLNATPLSIEASTDERARTWTTLKTFWTHGLVSEEMMLREMMRFDALTIDRAFAIEFMKSSERRNGYGAKELIVNRATIAILEGRLNTTQATFLALTLPQSISEAIVYLRERSADLTLKSGRWGGDEFRGMFASLTLAALFAKNQDFEGNLPRSRMPEARNIIELIYDLESGVRQRGANFDRAALETRDALLIAVAKGLRSGDAGVLAGFESETAALIKRLGSTAAFQNGIEIAVSAVDFAVKGLSSAKVEEARAAFLRLADKEALTEITIERPKARGRGHARGAAPEAIAERAQVASAGGEAVKPLQQQQPQFTQLQQQQQVGRQLNAPSFSSVAMALGCEMAFVPVK